MRGSKTLVLIFLASLCHAADYQVEGNIRYGSTFANVLDILQPRAPALQKRPVVVLIRDGGWGPGDKESIVQQVAAPFIQRDFVVALVEYGQTEASKDVLQAVGWVRDHADQYKIDPRRIIVIGASAGGRLALQAASLAPADSVAAVIEFFGATEASEPLLSKKGLPPVLAIGPVTPEIWPQIFKWLKKRKITS